MMRFREKIEAKYLDLLAKTSNNYTKMKQTLIADFLSFIKERDRHVSGVT